MSPEQRLAAQQKSAETRLANRAKAEAAAAAEPRGEAPPDPPENYGRLRESGQGGAIDRATHNIGGLGETDPVVTGRQLAPDIVGYGQEEPHTRPARAEDVPFHDGRRAASQPGPGAAPPTRAPVLAQGSVLVLPDWETVELQEGQDSLDAAYKLLEQGGKVLQQRVSTREVAEGYTCVHCGTPVPDLRNAKMIQARRDSVTGLIVNDVWCSARCYTAGINTGSFAAKK
jgi:hypothetical protein